MVKYLTNKEKLQTRPIWEKIFLEDTEKLLDYYYSLKTLDNEILAKIIDNKIVSMLHLNPYKIVINNNVYNSYYVVAVATLEEYRKKGYMAELIKSSLNYCYNLSMPFIFLRPAKEEIYLPFGFRYIYNHNTLDFDITKFKTENIDKNDYKFLADFTTNYLKNKYNVFCLRDEHYMEILHQEVKSENGDILKVYDNENFIGYYVYWGTSEKIIREVFLKNICLDIKETKPLVMARIIDINNFFKNFSLREDNEDIVLYLKITDNIIEQNNGLYKLTISKNKSYIEKATNADKIFNIDISDLASLFFGYKDIKEFTEDEDIINKFYKIALLDRVFIDEEI